MVHLPYNQPRMTHRMVKKERERERVREREMMREMMSTLLRRLRVLFTVREVLAFYIIELS